MLEPQTKAIGDHEFTFMPLNPFRASVMDKRVISVLVPLLGGLKNLDGADGESEELADMIDFAAVADGLSKALMQLPDADLEAMLKELLRSVTVQYTGADGKLVAARCDEAKGQFVFMGNLGLMYEVAIEVMRFNKFSPFALLERGSAMRAIGSFVSPKPAPSKPGIALDQSEN